MKQQAILLSTLVCLPICMLCATVCFSQEAENESQETTQTTEREIITLWPDGLPPGATPLSEEKIAEARARDTAHVTYVDSPTLTVYPAPEGIATGTAVIICPGGGYQVLAWDHEGIQLAEWFNSIGVHAFILKYRVPRREAVLHREPLQDLQRAIRIVRSSAEVRKVNPDKIGVMGFSAGGHLTLMSGFHYAVNSYEPATDMAEVSARPDFIMPIYAAYMGEDYKDDKAELGHLIEVTDQTPPTFLAVTSDDNMRGALAALLYARLVENGVNAEIHSYSQGGHGYGIRPSDNPVSTWHIRLAEWMKVSGF